MPATVPVTDDRQGLPSASEMHRIMACPGYWVAKKRWPQRDPDSDDMATAGTDIHEALEYMIDGRPIEMTLKERQQFVADNCNAIRIKLTAQLFGGEDKVEDKWVEKRWFMRNNSAEGKPNVMTAKPDLVLYTSGLYVILDYKTGPKEVPDATQNWQIASAAASMFDDPAMVAERTFNSVVGAIIQPLVTSDPKLVRMDVQQVQALRQQMLTRFSQINLPGQPRIPGPHCAYCPVSHACFEAQSTGMILQRRFDKLGAMSAQQLAAVHGVLGAIEARCEEVRQFIKQRLRENPNAIPGLKLEKVNAGHDVVDKLSVLKALMPTITKEEFWSLAKVPVAALREIFVDRTAEGTGITKKEALAMWEDRIVPLLQKKPERELIRKVEDGKP